MKVQDNRWLTNGREIGDCAIGDVVRFQDKEGFYLIIDYCQMAEFYGETTEYDDCSFIVNCETGEIEAIKDYIRCYPVEAVLHIE